MAEVLQEPDILESIELLELSDTFTRSERYVKSSSQRFVAFYLGTGLFALPAETVSEVMHPWKVTSLPGGPQRLIGITPVRGEVVAVLDIKQAVGADDSTAVGRGKLIVLNPTGRHTQLAFPADKMYEIVLLAENEIEPELDRSRGLLLGRARTAGMTVHIIDATRLPVLLNYTDLH